MSFILQNKIRSNCVQARRYVIAGGKPHGNYTLAKITFVLPAQAGIHTHKQRWIGYAVAFGNPAFAGMTNEIYATTIGPWSIEV